ncbi:tRNA pseudouridine(13) synthase TruD [Planctomycetota bacterium]|nr:tRNA pseudouridine(13) synthase TruD [Planctomycetota bacterium]
MSESSEQYPANPLPTPNYLTAEIEGTGGVIKQRPEDFLVEELPLYEPNGEGEHVYLFIEKREMTTLDVARRIARAFHVRKSDVGYAGLKDKHAITRQHFSVYLPKKDNEEEGLKNLLIHQNMTLLWNDRHANKLRRGHHGGNRFVVRIRDIEINSILRAKKALDILLKEGVPNRFGLQRFGYRHNSHTLGYQLLTEQYQAFMDEMLGHGIELDTPALAEARRLYREGDYAAALEAWPKSLRFDRQAIENIRQGKSIKKAALSVDRTQLNLLISATQSAIFNDVLESRIANGTFNKLLPGDLAFLHGNRAVFAVDKETAEKENAPDGRISMFEISPSGPMWGPSMTQTQDEVSKLEIEALNRQNLSIEQLKVPDRKLNIEGARRPLRIQMKNLDMDGGADEHGNYIRLAFDLPRGAFATNILAEIMKN